jgi:hypothetical protein
MVSSGLLRRVALVRTDVSEENGASIRVTKISELGTIQAATSNLVFLRSERRLLVAACFVPSSPIFVTLMMEALSSSETSGLTRATRRNISGDVILHSHRRENFKSYKGKFVTTIIIIRVLPFEHEWENSFFRFFVPFGLLYHYFLPSFPISYCPIIIILLIATKQSTLQSNVCFYPDRGKKQQLIITLTADGPFRDRTECCGLDWSGSG